LPHPDSITYGVPAEQIARLTGVHVTTARRYKRGEPVPEPVARLLSIMLLGDIGALDASWRGWRVIRGELYGPDLANGFRPGDVLSLPFVRLQLKNYQSEERAARRAGAEAELETDLSGAADRAAKAR